MTSRPLGRSLDPLPGESLNGFLLRLSFRLRVPPAHLARLAGITVSAARRGIPRRLLLDLDSGSLAGFARLTPDQAAALTLLPWARRYPPAGRSLRAPGRMPQADDWLFSPGNRYCPRCLAGDGSPVQDELGGCWKLEWQLPVAFACTGHETLLQDGCPQDHPSAHGRRIVGPLIDQAGDDSLHPAQCRFPLPGTASTGHRRQACGHRLDLVPDGPAPLPPEALAAQRHILAMLSPQTPAADAAGFFTGLRVITAFLVLAWPAAADLAEPAIRPIISTHPAGHADSTRPAHDRPPRTALAGAGLLTTARAVLDDPGRQEELAAILRSSATRGLSRTPWWRILARHRRSCPPQLRESLEPGAREYPSTGGSRSTTAPSRTGGYRPEHIPALLEQHWHDEHLARLGNPGQLSLSMRRAGSILLVQWAAGGSMADAADYLGILRERPRTPPKHDREHTRARYYPRWLSSHDTEDFADALRALADRLDAAPSLIDYQRRRDALRDWSLSTDDWQEIASRLPPAPRKQPLMDDRQRQEASAFTWARITQGEPRFAPRPIEALQPEHVRTEWRTRRSAAWGLLNHTGRSPHYASLRKILIEHANRLADAIDHGERH